MNSTIALPKPPKVPTTVKIPKLPMPKPIAVKAPKIASIHLTPMKGGTAVTRNMTHGPKPVPFVFSDPNRMLTHLKRIQDNQWRMPDRNEGPAVGKALDLAGTGTSSW